jgi:hypothetical protein
MGLGRVLIGQRCFKISHGAGMRAMPISDTLMFFAVDQAKNFAEKYPRPPRFWRTVAFSALSKSNQACAHPPDSK